MRGTGHDCISGNIGQCLIKGVPMSRFIARHLREFPAKTYHREDGSATLGIGILQHGCLAGLVLKNLLELVRIPGKSELLPSSL